MDGNKQTLATLKAYFGNIKLPYFVREILITACGILLAFLLNHWNENRKDQNNERIFLKDYSNTLKLDSVDLQSNVAAVDSWTDDIMKILEARNSTIDISESLNFASSGFEYIFFIPISQAKYEELKQNNFQLIKDDSLRSMIINYYEENLYVLKVNESQFNLIREDLRDYYTDYFTTWSSGDPKPLDYKFVMTDVRFKNLIEQKASSFRYIGVLSQRTIEKASMIRKRIAEFVD